MRTVVMIAGQIQAALFAAATRVDEIWNHAQAQGDAEDAHLAGIDGRLTSIEAQLQLIVEAVTEPGTSPDQGTVDALMAQVAAATSRLNQSTGGLEAAVTKETQTP